MKVNVSQDVLSSFRRRALRRYPKEYMETIWGHVKGGEGYIYAFHPIKHKSDNESIEYEPAAESSMQVAGPLSAAVPCWRDSQMLIKIVDARSRLIGRQDVWSFALSGALVSNCRIIQGGVEELRHRVH